MPGEITFRWLGVAGFTLQLDGFTLSVDPFFTRPPVRNIYGGRPKPRPELAEVYLPVCEVILVTHAHHDHLMDAPGIAQRTGARLYGSLNSCRIAQLYGLPEGQTRVVEAGETFTIGAYQVQAIAAQHARIPFFGPGELKSNLRIPLKLHEYRMDHDYSYLIEANGARVLDWMSVSAQGAAPAEVLLCGSMLDDANLVRLLEVVQPSLVIPTHWDHFFRPLQDGLRVMPGARLKGHHPQVFARRVRKIQKDCQVWIPELFGPVELTRFY